MQSALMDDSRPLAFDATDPLERARAHAVAQALEPLELEDLAAVAGLSAYHFTRQFTARFGLSPMAFVREQRMAMAAGRLTEPRPPALVDLAFDLGFESQEGFTRAFKRAFGVSPGRFRRDGGAAPPSRSTVMTTATLPLSLTQAPEPRRHAGLRIAGYAGVFDETNRSGIPDLWPKLVRQLPLPGQAGGGSFGVMWAEDGPGGAFHYLAGAAIAEDAPVPEGMEIRTLAPQTYLVFRQVLDGPQLHPQMQAAAREIWGERLPSSGRRLARAPDLEVYPEGFDRARPGAWVEWWIPIEA